eukprot:gnl/Hemi2/6995_TR2394_c0_g1_i1.p1 gnl/Hemi2/6995_TR2394_c0_g1~~gnl/Hemi2/6995_TR2394_c0_g1_i1.p1  ORF type:complete len:132 (+),score=23.93 gnl/Hemi2/6995_TR2394_c0_g1_i1:79-474(+)
MFSVTLVVKELCLPCNRALHCFQQLRHKTSGAYKHYSEKGRSENQKKRAAVMEMLEKKRDKKARTAHPFVTLAYWEIEQEKQYVADVLQNGYFPYRNPFNHRTLSRSERTQPEDEEEPEDEFEEEPEDEEE